MPDIVNLLDPLPDASDAERIEALLAADGVRLERIVSLGQVSPEGFWYDQADAEWVMLLKGRARLAIAGEAEERTLSAGDALFLPAHCKHRVTWTDPGEPAVWLALHVAARLNAAPVDA